MLLKTFPKNEYFVKHTLEDGKYSLAQEPVAFFWGFQSHPEVAFMYNQQGLAQQLKSKIKISIAQKVRNFLGSLLHDAVWVEKLGNKKAITQNLFETAHPNNEHVQPVIYFGHSAGSLVLFN